MLLTAAASAFAESVCRDIGDQVYCTYPNGQTSISQRIGNNTYYNYSNPGAASKQGLPNSAQVVGTTRSLEGAPSTKTDPGIAIPSSSVAKPPTAGFDFYSNGTSCQVVGNTRYCN